MIYCVVPTALADELFDKLTEYYRDDENVEVIVERRRFDRRARQRPSRAGDARAPRQSGTAAAHGSPATPSRWHTPSPALGARTRAAGR